jgi:hypothetical protein
MSAARASLRWLSRGADAAPGMRPAFTAPPVPDGHVRLHLQRSDYDTEAQWSEWKPAQTERVPEYLFDVPAEQAERWERAYAAFYEARDEIDALIEQRGWNVPPGWEPAP